MGGEEAEAEGRRAQQPIRLPRLQRLPLRPTHPARAHAHPHRCPRRKACARARAPLAPARGGGEGRGAPWAAAAGSSTREQVSGSYSAGASATSPPRAAPAVHTATATHLRPPRAARERRRGWVCRLYQGRVQLTFVKSILRAPQRQRSVGAAGRRGGGAERSGPRCVGVAAVEIAREGNHNRRAPRAHAGEGARVDRSAPQRLVCHLRARARSARRGWRGAGGASGAAMTPQDVGWRHPGGGWRRGVVVGAAGRAGRARAVKKDQASSPSTRAAAPSGAPGGVPAQRSEPARLMETR